MFITKLPSGREVYCSSVEEVLALDAALPAASIERISGPVFGRESASIGREYMPPRRNVEFTLNFLRTLMTAGRRGILAGALAAETGVDGSRGLGGAVSMVNRTIRELGLPPVEAFSSKTSGEETRWYSDPAIAESFANHIEAVLQAMP